ncbi:hypothetical protein C3L33_18146, partial [Rhododendron williamsianum]
MTSYRIASVPEMNSLVNFGKFFQERSKISLKKAMIMERMWFLDCEHRSEDEEMSKCRSAIQRVKKMEEEVDRACSKAKDPNRKTLSKELEGKEHVLKESIEKLKVVEANRTALVSQLQEALHEQEAELENVHTQMQLLTVTDSLMPPDLANWDAGWKNYGARVAQARAEEARKMRKLLDDDEYIAVAKQSNMTPPPIYTSAKGGQQPKKSAAAIAAEVADRLAASTSSQYIMSSVLSSFAAEEAKNAALTMSSSAFSSFPTPPVNSLSHLPPPQLSTAPSTTYQSLLVQQPTLQQTQTLTSSQTQYHMVTTPSPQHYVQPSGVMVNSYSYVMPPLPPGPPPPPPPPQPHMITQQQPPALTTQQHSMPLPQQPPAPPSFRPLGLFQPPEMVYYGHHHQSS